MTEGLQLQTKILSELRKTDQKIGRLKEGLQSVPTELAKIDSAIAQGRGALDEAKKALEASEKRLRSLELDLREQEGQIDKAAARLMDVKTNQEYQAALKENEERKEEKGKLEEELLKLITEVEGQRKVVAERESEFKDFSQKFQADRERLSGEKVQLESLLEEQKKKREAACLDLDPKLKETYQRLSSGGNQAIALVDNAVCQGCRTMVRPQLYNEMLGYKAIHRCSSCGRLLVVWQDNGSTDQ